MLDLILTQLIMIDLTLIGIFGLGMIGTCIQSVLAPFFPTLAEEHGLDSKSTGLIFGIQPLVAAVCAPGFGMILAFAGRKRILLLCAFLLVIPKQGVSSLSFAFIPMFDTTSFIVVGLISRIFQGVGGAGLGTSIIAIISTTYRNNVGELFGIQQTLTGISMIIGPIIGAVLFLIGGFSFIFYSFAAIFFAGIVFIFFVLPKDEPYQQPKIPVTWSILCSVKVFSKQTVPLDCLVIAMCFGALGALEPVLGIFLVKQFGISTASIAYVFIVPTAFYPLTVLMMNLFMKKIPDKAKMCLGLVVVGFGMIIAGPCTLTGLQPSFILTIIALALLGMGMAFAMIPSLPDMLNDSGKQLSHIEPSLVTDRLSGLVALSIYLGKAVAAPIAGVLKEVLEFQDAIAVFGFFILGYSILYGLIGGGFKAMAGIRSQTIRSDSLLNEKEMVQSKSFYLLEEDEV